MQQTVWSAKPEIFTVCTFTEKVFWPLVYINTRIYILTVGKGADKRINIKISCISTEVKPEKILERYFIIFMTLCLKRFKLMSFSSWNSLDFRKMNIQCIMCISSVMKFPSRSVASHQYFCRSVCEYPFEVG